MTPRFWQILFSSSLLLISCSSAPRLATREITFEGVRAPVNPLEKCAEPVEYGVWYALFGTVRLLPGDDSKYFPKPEKHYRFQTKKRWYDWLTIVLASFTSINRSTLVVQECEVPVPPKEEPPVDEEPRIREPRIREERGREDRIEENPGVP